MSVTGLSVLPPTPQRLVTIMEFLFGEMVAAAGAAAKQTNKNIGSAVSADVNQEVCTIKFNSTSVERHKKKTPHSQQLGVKWGWISQSIGDYEANVTGFLLWLNFLYHIFFFFFFYFVSLRSKQSGHKTNSRINLF